MVFIYATQTAPTYVPPVEVKRNGIDGWREAVKKSQQIKAWKEQSEIKKTMDSAVLTLILSTVSILAAVWFNPKMLKIERQVADNHELNRVQHDEIKDELKHLKAPEKLESTIRQLTAGKLESCDPDLREFINDESERLISVSGEIVRGGFDYNSLSQSLIKIDLAQKDSLYDACALGKSFCDLYKVHLSEVCERFKDEISDIVLDEVFNSKQARFSLACQVFLRDHMKGIIRIFGESNKA